MKLERNNEKGVQRWQHNRFGMFIHWGLYALPARHEWVKSQERLEDKDYQRYFEIFDPDLYDPTEWAAYAKRAGMRYVVLTAKHHEGFCLFESQYTDYKSTNTKCGKDLIQMYADAFRSAGIRIGIYYSLLDWHHPDYPLDVHHPMRENDEFKKIDGRKDMAKYAEYLHAQVRELLTNYGEIDSLFFDFSVKNRKTGEVQKGRDAWNSVALVNMVRELQPNILINDRLDLDEVDGGWDYRTPEQITPRGPIKFNETIVPWEGCQTFSGSWGYHRDESSWKSTEQLVKMLIDTVGKGGNLLLNVGPTARGEFDQRAIDRLNGIGEWMRLHDRSIYGCTIAPGEFKDPLDCRLTYNPESRRVYVHIFSWPPTGELYLDGFAGKVTYAQLLNDASELKFGARESWQMSWGDADSKTLSLKLPIRPPNVAVPVVELYL